MKWLSRIMYGVFAIVVISTALLFLSPSLPYIGHVDLKIVKSGSMEPNIMTGGVVLVRASDVYRVGDVITFVSSGSDIPTTHRVVGTEEQGGESLFVTKGDANEERDTNLVQSGAILGKVLFTVPYAGFVFDFARQPIGFMLLIGLPALLIVIDEVEKIWNEIRRKRKPVVHVTRGTVAAIPPLVVAPYIPIRVRRMDIVRPKKAPVILKNEAPKQSVPPVIVRRDVGSHWILATSIALALAISSVNLWFTGFTISYLSDVESSLENFLGAVALGFTATPDSTSFTFIDGTLDDPDGLITLVAPEVGSALMKHTVSVAYVSGSSTLCDSLSASTSVPFSYNGALMALSATEITFSGPWILDITLADGAYLPAEQCVVDIVYTGWSAVKDESDGGYDDEERTRLTFTAPEQVLLLSPATQIFESLNLVSEEVIPESPSDGNSGHGNDEDGIDDSNSGKSNAKVEQGSASETERVSEENLTEIVPETEEMSVVVEEREDAVPEADETGSGVGNGEEEALDVEDVEEAPEVPEVPLEAVSEPAPTSVDEVV